MRRALFLALALTLLGLTGESPALQPKPPASKPLTVYTSFRELMAEGKFDIAAVILQKFLESNPTDADFLEIDKKYGSTALTMLRTVPKWSDDAASDKQTRAVVDELVKRSKAATDKLLRDPLRVAKFIRNLGATYEERAYAELELKRIGEFAIPFMVEELRTTTDKEQYAGLIGAIKELDSNTIAGWVAALDGLRPDQQYGVINAIASRPDVLELQTFAQSDLSPILWRIMSQPKETQNPTLRALAENLLNKLNPGARADTKSPETELTALARTFYDHTARYTTMKNNPAGSSTVPMWVWDPKTQKVSKIEDVPVAQAEEYYGLRAARWALERKPDYAPAQGLILALAAERAMERAKFGNLAKAEPGVFKLLSDAPSPVLNDLLNRALNQKKTALALAMIQVLSDRADRDAATPPAGVPAKQSLLVKALKYPDPQVQFAAATALLRSPVPVPNDVRGDIVDILRRAAGADPGVPSDSKGTALLASPSRNRAGALAALLRGLGYEVEIFGTGRDLLRRVTRASDFDLILIDRQTPNPELIDLIGQLQADAKVANRPTFVIATTDKPRVPTFDQLIVRLAALIAATELEVPSIPPPYVPDPRDIDLREEIAKARKSSQEKRDGAFRTAAADRMARLQRVIDTTGLQLSATQKLLFDLRLQLVTFSVLGAEFPISPESAPATAHHLLELRKQLDLQPASPPYGTGLPTTDLLKLMERFEIDLARVPAAKKRFEDLYAKIDLGELGLPVERFRDPLLEAKLARTLVNYPDVRVIPEPYGRADMASYLKAAYTDPAQTPRDPAEKKAAQKLAVEWLTKMATGAVPGFEVKSAEDELRAALRIDDLAETAIDAVARFGSANAQQDLLALAITPGRPLPTRNKAADAAIRHIQVNGKLIPQTLVGPLAELSDKESDPALRGKLLTLKGLLGYKQDDFLNQLKSYDPPLLPVEPPKLPPKDPKDPKDPKPPQP